MKMTQWLRENPGWTGERYCFACGSELEYHEVRIGFSSSTGKPMRRNWAECPRRRWWNAWEMHTSNGRVMAPPPGLLPHD